jgi:phosphatidylserine decarboxylase
MIEDIKRTFKEILGWVFTILPIGKRTALEISLLALLALLIYLLTKACLQIYIFWIYLAIAFFVAFFFRDPVRNTVFADDEIACPADGEILSIKTEDNPDILVIRIFLSVFNVHIQRAAINGKVEDIIYTKGTFSFADNPAANINQRNLIKISNGEKFAHIEQITGWVARRIEAWVKKGDEVKAGQKIGLIYFGSQVAVYLPKDKVKITVKEEQNVQGGLTVLGLWR